jgi:hypothetical protein
MCIQSIVIKAVCNHFSLSHLQTTTLWLMLIMLPNSLAAKTVIFHPNQKIFTAAAFAPDGRLWRLMPADKFVSVDYSQDFGKTFSKPVRINKQDKAINLWDENPPSLSVDKQGRIYVLYFADDKKENASFFSHSEDGIHFSEPVKISQRADFSYQYQAEMLVDHGGKAHFIWHDGRDKKTYVKQGRGDLSLYHVAVQAAKNRAFPADHRIAEYICSCCRTAMALDVDGNPVILARIVYPGNIRDHGMLKLTTDGKAGEPWRVTFDNWKIEGCPTSGPALSISNDGRYHISWFTQGTEGTGLFYAWSDDQGKTFSKPLKIGNPEMMSGKADVLASGKQVVLAWKTFDGVKTRIEAIRSEDRGLHWSAVKSIAETESQSQHPALISDGKRIFLSWSSLDNGYRLVPID